MTKLAFDEQTRELAKRYDKALNHFSKWTPSVQLRTIFKEAILGLLGNETSLSKKIRILDVGCGHGTWIKYILDRIQDPTRLDITGIDISEGRIRSAKDLLADYPNVSLYVEDFRLYDSAEKYNIISFVEVLSLIPKRYYRDIFKKCFELLCNPAFLIIIDKERYSLFSLRFLVRKKMKLFQQDPIYARAGTYKFVTFPSFALLSRIAKKTHFRILKKLRVKEFHALTLLKQT